MYVILGKDQYFFILTNEHVKTFLHFEKKYPIL